jgi:hypothetical protein
MCGPLHGGEGKVAGECCDRYYVQVCACEREGGEAQSELATVRKRRHLFLGKGKSLYPHHVLPSSSNWHQLPHRTCITATAQACTVVGCNHAAEQPTHTRQCQRSNARQDTAYTNNAPKKATPLSTNSSTFGHGTLAALLLLLLTSHLHPNRSGVGHTLRTGSSAGARIYAHQDLLSFSWLLGPFVETRGASHFQPTVCEVGDGQASPTRDTLAGCDRH